MKTIPECNIVDQKSNLFQYLAALSGTLSVFVNGMQYGWTSPYLPQLFEEDSEVQITNDEGSLIAIFILIGLAVGCASGPLLADLIGRKLSALTSAPLFIASAVLTIFADSIEYFYVSRFLAGVADGVAFTSMPMYLGEVASPKIRGLICSSAGFAFIFGIFLVNLIGIYITMQQCAIILIVIPIIFMFTFSWMPESPYYYVKKNKIEKAKRSLEIFRGTKDVDAELKDIQFAVQKQEENGKYIHLFTVNSHRKALFIILGLKSIQELSGITAFTFHTKMIFAQGGGNFSPSWCAVIFTGIQALVSSISSLIVDKTGRKPLLIISTIGSIIALVTEGLYFYCKDELRVISDDYYWISVVALIGYIIMFAIGLGPTPILMLGELFPTGIKAPAMCLMGIYYALISTIVTKFYQFVGDSYGPHTPFFTFALCCCFGLIFIIKMVPETTHKSLEEIQDILKSNH